MATLLRYIARSIVNTRVFSTSATASAHAEYSVRLAVPADLEGISELRKKVLWTHQTGVDMDHQVLIHQCQQPFFYCIVAVKNDREEIASIDGAVEEVTKEKKDVDHVYGALDLMVGANAERDLFLLDLPEKIWRSGPTSNEDGYITNLGVNHLVRRRLVATNLLNFAKDVAKEKGMKKIFVEVGCHKKEVVKLNTKCGYEILSYDDNDDARGIVMGLKL